MAPSHMWASSFMDAFLAIITLFSRFAPASSSFPRGDSGFDLFSASCTATKGS